MSIRLSYFIARRSSQVYTSPSILTCVPSGIFLGQATVLYGILHKSFPLAPIHGVSSVCELKRLYPVTWYVPYERSFDTLLVFSTKTLSEANFGLSGAFVGVLVAWLFTLSIGLMLIAYTSLTVVKNINIASTMVRILFNLEISH